ncbi:MAG: methyltransferase domain-containing protein [Oligoflexia bacterium]|nr:methyltransferase domain-containing protein [Oligoflexia bacterium]
MKKTGITPEYLHGYTPEEQDRLYRQARFLEKSVYSRIDFSKQKNILEVGCGVGAQTEILLQRFPHLQIQGIDASQKQIRTARARLKEAVTKKKARFDVQDALHLSYEDDSFDGAFVCWFLEHVQEPVGILHEIRRVLSPGSVIYCNEVLNATLYLNPYSPATLQYWFAFNDHQWTIKGDPFVGGKLANYLLAAGFQDVETETKVEFHDNRAPKRRAQFIEYWAELLLSGAPGLLKAGKVTPQQVKDMKDELGRLKDDPDAVFFYAWIQARARAF